MALKLFRRPPKNLFSLGKNTVAAIGNFDGIHRGHQKILEKTLQIACKTHCLSVLISFEPYPYSFFYPEKPILRLTSLREKIRFLQKTSLDYLYLLPFNGRLSAYSPEQFTQEILKDLLKTRCIVIGEDFRFGRQRKGDADFLRAQDFLRVVVLPAALDKNLRISSTEIRKTLKIPNFEKARLLLGRSYTITGRVIKGDQRGRTLGFPTANIALGKRIPAFTGVYAVKVLYKHQYFIGAANIGIRPTISQHDKKIFLETHILNFNKNIYGQYIDIIFYKKIRSEQKFASLEALKLQIQQDLLETKKIFKTKIHKNI